MNDSVDSMQAFYREQVLRHSREPHNCRPMDEADLSAEGFNPLCGDKVSVFLRVDGDTIAAVSYTHLTLPTIPLV